MFKIKSKNNSFTRNIEKTYLIYSHPEYQYVITDDPSLIENDKINIVFSEDIISKADELLRVVISGVELYLNLKCKDGIKKVSVRDIEYFEALENEVYAVVENTKYICDDKLYTLEQMLENKYYVRTSKSFLVNILKIKYIKPMLNYKYLLIMNNGDEIDVNRTYLKAFKNKLNI